MSSELERVNPNAPDMIKMMRRSASEIKDLRKILDAIGPRAEAYEVIKKILSLVPGPGMGAGEDYVYTLEQEAKKLEERLERARMTNVTKPGDPR
jgi:hypothetical protein